MEVIDIDTTKLIDLGDNLITISNNLDSYNKSFEEYVTKLQVNGIWKGSSATTFRNLSKKDVVQYIDYSESIKKLGEVIKREAEALEDEIKSLKDI